MAAWLVASSWAARWSLAGGWSAIAGGCAAHRFFFCLTRTFQYQNSSKCSQNEVGSPPVYTN